MNLKDRYNLETLGNTTQELVFEGIERLIEKGATMCTCEECVMDLAAWTLNHTTPRYYTSLLGPLRSDPARENTMRMEIELALAAGLKKLARHRHHD